jgi:hypothetical protein
VQKGKYTKVKAFKRETSVQQHPRTKSDLIDKKLCKVSQEKI